MSQQFEQKTLITSVYLCKCNAKVCRPAGTYRDQFRPSGARIHHETLVPRVDGYDTVEFLILITF